MTVMLFFRKKIPGEKWRVRCHDATASSFVTKVWGEVLAHSHAVAIKHHSIMQNWLFGLPIWIFSERSSKKSAHPPSSVKFCTLTPNICWYYHLLLNCATTTVVQTATPVPEIMDTLINHTGQLINFKSWRILKNNTHILKRYINENCTLYRIVILLIAKHGIYTLNPTTDIILYAKQVPY
jgi:hypothetical protein